MRLRFLVTAVLLMFAALGVFAQSATFEAVSGKVEIRRAGGSWEPARVGMAIDRETTISTGFGASATLDVADNTLEVEQLTRMTLVSLVESSDQVDTEVFLGVGRVSANVRTAERRQNFEVRSPMSTAAVRGTRFRFDGQRLQVFEGTVAFANSYGQSQSVGAGQQSTITEAGAGPSSPQDEAEDQASTSIAPLGPDTGDDDDGGETGVPGAGRGRETRGGVSVELTYER